MAAGAPQRPCCGCGLVSAFAYAGATQRNPVSLSRIVAAAAFRSDGAALSKGEVKALPFRSYRPLPGVSSVEHHSHTLPDMSNTPKGLTPDW